MEARMGQKITALLKSDGYFFCEATHCRLRKEMCVKRQGATLQGYVRQYKRPVYHFCQNCQQGLDIKRELAESYTEDAALGPPTPLVAG